MRARLSGGFTRHRAGVMCPHQDSNLGPADYEGGGSGRRFKDFLETAPNSLSRVSMASMDSMALRRVCVECEALGWGRPRDPSPSSQHGASNTRREETLYCPGVAASTGTNVSLLTRFRSVIPGASVTMSEPFSLSAPGSAITLPNDRVVPPDSSIIRYLVVANHCRHVHTNSLVHNTVVARVLVSSCTSATSQVASICRSSR